MDPLQLPTMGMADYVLHRLDDTIFWAIPLLGVLVCAIHAARRAFRQPSPQAEPEEKAAGGHSQAS